MLSAIVKSISYLRSKRLCRKSTYFVCLEKMLEFISLTILCCSVGMVHLKLGAGVKYWLFFNLIFRTRHRRLWESFFQSVIFFLNSIRFYLFYLKGLFQLCQFLHKWRHDHPFQTSAICRGGGVKNWSNLPMDNGKKLPTEGGGGEGSKIVKICRRLKWMVPNLFFSGRVNAIFKNLKPP